LQRHLKALTDEIERHWAAEIEAFSNGAGGGQQLIW
jgi:hypothetical protein